MHMKRLLLSALVPVLFIFSACSDDRNIATGGGEGEVLKPGEVPYQEFPDKTDGDLHGIFYGELGIPFSPASMGAIDPDPTGHSPSNDYDGDGIPNNQEIITNPFVADYPRIVTRITAPLTMEIRVSTSSVEENYT